MSGPRGEIGPGDATVVVATYRHPAWLEKCLWGFAVQTRPGFELIVTDDGSGPETAEAVRRFRHETGLEVIHLWQEDRGHRKSRALNRAILQASGEYLIFTDGDCIPRRDFVATHLELAEEGRFLSGGALNLPPELSARLSTEDVRDGRAFRLGWLVARGWRPGRRVLRLLRSRRLAGFLDLITPTSATFNGGNSSAWRDDAVRVNGFDHRMGYGGQDRAFGECLENAGVEGRQVRHRAVCLHLHHERPYRTEEGLRTNDRIRRRIRAEGRVRAGEGLQELAASEDRRGPEDPSREDRGSEGRRRREGP